MPAIRFEPLQAGYWHVDQYTIGLTLDCGAKCWLHFHGHQPLDHAKTFIHNGVDKIELFHRIILDRGTPQARCDWHEWRWVRPRPQPPVPTWGPKIGTA